MKRQTSELTIASIAMLFVLTGILIWNVQTHLKRIKQLENTVENIAHKHPWGVLDRIKHSGRKGGKGGQWTK